MPQDPIAIIEAIIANAMLKSDEYSEKADTAGERLLTQSLGFYLTPTDSNTGFEISAVEPNIPEVSDSVFTYEAQLEKLVALLEVQLGGFFAQYYPLNADAFDEATNWLVNAITVGGTGVNPAIEDQIWQRARERITADGRRAEEQIVTGYAAKGITMPAGSMLKKIEEVRFKQLATNGEASTTIAAKQLEIEIETVKFAVGKALESRQMAMSAAADYIRAIASSPDSALRTANLRDENRAKMMSAAATWYGARLDRDKIVLSSKLAEMESRNKIWDRWLTNNDHLDDTRIKALGASADVYARISAALVSSLNSIVSTASNI